MASDKRLYGFHLPANAVSAEKYRSSNDWDPDFIKQMQVRDWGADAFLLTTCERIDAYIYSEDFLAVKQWFSNICPDKKVDFKQGEEAVQYLFETASGIHSSNLGESEILHQVKKCLNQHLHGSGEAVVTKRLLQKALEAGKLVRTKTGIGNASLSYAGSVYDIIHEFAKSRDPQVAIIGGGSLGRSILKILLKKGGFKPTLVSRCEGNRKKIASQFGINVLSHVQFKATVSGFNVIVGAASTVEPMLDTKNFNRDALLIDLGMPPIFRVHNDVSVNYFDLSDLHKVFKKHQAVRKNHLPKAASIVRIKVKEFLDWLKLQQISPVLQYLSGKSKKCQSHYLIQG